MSATELAPTPQEERTASPSDSTPFQAEPLRDTPPEQMPSEHIRLFKAEEAARRARIVGDWLVERVVGGLSGPENAELASAREAVQQAHHNQYLRQSDSALPRTHIEFHSQILDRHESLDLPVPPEPEVGVLRRIGRAAYDSFFGADRREDRRAKAAYKAHMRNAREELDANRLRYTASRPATPPAAVQAPVVTYDRPVTQGTTLRAAMRSFAARARSDITRSFKPETWDATPADYHQQDTLFHREASQHRNSKRAA